MFEEKLIWIEKGDKIFSEGKNPEEYAYFGWQAGMGVDVAYAGYIDGYKKGADTLVEYSLSMLKEGRIDVADTYVFPICFMYRQFVELALKSIYVIYSGDDDVTQEKNIKRVSHDLTKIWAIVRPIIEKNSLAEDDIDIAEDYVSQMHEYEKTSFEFRYPTEKNGNMIHEKWKYLDLVNLKERMEAFYNYYIDVFESLRIKLYGSDI